MTTPTPTSATASPATARDDTTPLVVSLDTLAQVQALYDRGLYLQAYQAAQAAGPLNRWQGPDARVLAGRLAANLGSHRLARALHRRAHLEAPAHPHALYFFVRLTETRRGPLAAWNLLRAAGDLPDAPTHVRAEWFSLHGSVLTQLRDFDRALAWLDKSEALGGERGWLLVERAACFQAQDRYDEALATARDALVGRPWYRPAVQQAGHLLTLLGRDDEALDFLAEAGAHIESGDTLAQLAALQQELGLHAAAKETLERIPPLWPLADKHHVQWLLNQRADTAYYTGDLAAAADLASQSKQDFLKNFAARLREAQATPAALKRKRLAVGFTRQHRMTCVPATLATLTRYWDKPHEHLAIAEKICYDGTPQPADRQWATENGFLAREFTLTWDAAVALIDRDVPFIVSTLDPGSGHAQAVIGYDAVRGTLLIRDPFLRHQSEFIADKALERYKSSGPRALALVPAEKAALLDGLDLPDAPLYDLLYDLQQALDVHDRPRAVAAADALKAAAADHRLTHYGARCVAAYDANTPGILAATEALAALYPDDLNIQLTKLSCLRDLARRDERLALLKDVCTGAKAHPLFWQRYAMELQPDARAHNEALRWTRKALRHGPTAALTYHIYAQLLWSRREFEQAFELSRFATCLEDKDEDFAGSYFLSSLYFHRSHEALDLLRSRYERFGGRSSLPGRTLFRAYEQIDQTGEAFAVLSDALAKRPDESDLLLFAANAHARYGRFEQAASLLARAEGKTRRPAWLFYAAELADLRGDLPAALSLYRELVEIDPLSVDAHRAVARLIAETESRAAAIAHLRAAVARFPNHVGLHELLILTLREEGPAAMEPALRALLDVHPDSSWARRELAWVLADLNRDADALAEATLARQLAPNAAVTFDILAHVHRAAGRVAEARADLEHSLRLSVDNESAIASLIGLCNSTQERRRVLALVRQELVRQVIFGDGLLALRTHASTALPPEELLAQLREAHAARPDLWHAWSALAAQLLAMNHKDDALLLARQACERFPLLPRVWVDRAEVHVARQEADEAIAALRQALEISPNWSRPSRMLAELHDRRGEFGQAASILRQAIARTPLDPLNHVSLAHVLWKLDDRDGCIQHLQRALTLGPDLDFAWQALRHYAAQLARPSLPADHARTLTQQKTGDAACWLALARSLPPDAADERIAAARKAIELQPRNTDGYDILAVLLAEAARYDEARAACAPAAITRRPTELRARAAWVSAREGNLRRAITEMEALVLEDRTCLWAWQRLADWYRALDRNDEYHRTALRLVELWPREPNAREYLADACLRLGRRSEARDILRELFAANPDSPYTASTLADVLIEDGLIDDAEPVLATMEAHHTDPDELAARRFRIAIARGDKEAAAQWLGTLALSPSAVESNFDYAMHAVNTDLQRTGTINVAPPASTVGLVDALVAAMRAALGQEKPNPHAAAMLVRLLEIDRKFHDMELAANMPARGGEAWNNAMAQFIGALAEHREMPTLRSVVSAYGAAMRPDTRLWSMVGWALGVAGDDHVAIAGWYADWRVRSDARPRPLLYLANALRELRRTDEAGDVSRRALELPDDGTHPAHASFLAADAALAPRLPSPAAALQEARAISRESLGAYYCFIADLAVVLLEVAAARAEGRRIPGAQVKKNIARALAHVKDFHTDGILRRLYVSAMWRLFALTWSSSPLLASWALLKWWRED